MIAAANQAYDLSGLADVGAQARRRARVCRAEALVVHAAYLRHKQRALYGGADLRLQFARGLGVKPLRPLAAPLALLDGLAHRRGVARRERNV